MFYSVLNLTSVFYENIQQNNKFFLDDFRFIFM